MDADYESDAAIAAGLPRAWGAFFGRFGRLREVQRQAIPPILEGQDVLVCSPTASGKTEAACAPLIERSLGRWAQWTILYISPTRALVNDLYERLHAPLQGLDLALKRRTGDHHDSLSSPPNVLLTTPESFDSLMCRGRDNRLGHALAHVIAVVLDEIHLLHGSPRGEQIRWLLSRLARLRQYGVAQGWTKSAAVQRLGLSATIQDPQRVIDDYLPGGRLVSAPGGRLIETVAPPSTSTAVEDALPALLRTSEAPEKVLVFCNKRRRVDGLAENLRDLLTGTSYEVRAHHGSLAQPEREATEAAIRKADRVVVVATSTLEIGVDIGDIDLVVLDGPAPDIPAFLQRIGRGNRRTERTAVLACADSVPELIVQWAMIQAARQGFLGTEKRGPQYAVARQQFASFIFQSPRGKRSQGALLSLAEQQLPAELAGRLLDHLATTGDLRRETAMFRLGGQWQEATTRGEIHSNIDDAGGQAVTDYDSGDQIAKGVRYRSGKGMSIAGHLLEVKKWDQRRVEVRRMADQPPPGNWTYATRPWFKGTGQAQALRQYLELPETAWPVIHRIGRTWVFHFGGGRRQALLELLAAREPDSDVESVTAWYVVFKGVVQMKPPWLTRSGAAMIDLTLAEHLEPLERTLARPRANRKLPDGMRVQEVRAWLDTEVELKHIREAEWLAPEPQVQAVLEQLARG